MFSLLYPFLTWTFSWIYALSWLEFLAERVVKRIEDVKKLKFLKLTVLHISICTNCYYTKYKYKRSVWTRTRTSGNGWNFNKKYAHSFYKFNDSYNRNLKGISYEKLSNTWCCYLLYKNVLQLLKICWHVDTFFIKF